MDGRPHTVVYHQRQFNTRTQLSCIRKTHLPPYTHTHTHAHTHTHTRTHRYLVTHDAGLSTTALVCFALLGLLGFYIFRAANSQKDAFRRDPTAPAVRHIKSITTQRGTNLMVSGWWGLARKINYTGDWLFGLSWSLFAGFGSVLPYFYPIYFGVLLVHRAWRDDHMCQEKYGDDWARFKKLVPYVFVPYLF